MDPAFFSAPKQYSSFLTQGSSQRVLSQQSPIVLKNKLDVLKNLYNKHQDQYNNLIEAE